ncbi:hypothetical protein GON03_21495 [Nocardioides sp. MAH-18]|uniref:Uncharacterized protein n=1 Tax=Nocardioides agri TaxID=2682843 RepID=A0A6L6XWI9_9ACTN|nr:MULTISPECIES: hypothetical protein [unclassified Nocardioides]MBA2952599.1 hypothetical protein [Nocardioides sp. CGMCC 1.13656]MVQ51761.1 hypothetical protein [Nocardioides sp. MAH-18]
MKTLILGIAATALGAVGAVASAADPPRADLLHQLEGRADVRQEMIGGAPTGLFQCAIRVLDRDGRTLYAWMRCGDFRTGPHAEELSGSSLAAVVRLDRQGDVARVRFPRQQSLRADIERMFPPDLQQRVLRGDIRTIPGEATLLHRAEDTAPRPPGAR